MAQDTKWGVQTHPDGTGTTHDVIASGLYKRWRDILLEEVYEAFAEGSGSYELRTELVHIAAVAIAWAESIDRRPRAIPDMTEERMTDDPTQP